MLFLRGFFPADARVALGVGKLGLATFGFDFFGFDFFGLDFFSPDIFGSTAFGIVVFGSSTSGSAIGSGASGSEDLSSGSGTEGGVMAVFFSGSFSVSTLGDVASGEPTPRISSTSSRRDEPSFESLPPMMRLNCSRRCFSCSARSFIILKAKPLPPAAATITEEIFVSFIELGLLGGDDKSKICFFSSPSAGVVSIPVSPTNSSRT
mmetsp:Transcript_5706/g.12681  ORF Transcript_5706/g.12681 Transcript_5706/m.12681 type:complete len:207 (-) Transcript_5706:166-786(-)